MWWRLPEKVCRAILRGELTTVDCLVAVLLSLGLHLGRTSLTWILSISALSRRALSYSLNGRGDDPRLSRFISREGGIVDWTPYRWWVRVGWVDLRALLRRPCQDSTRAWAWSLIHVSGRFPEPQKADVRELARACAWSYGRAYRAMYGASDREGAVCSGLVLVEGDYLSSNYPLQRKAAPELGNLQSALRDVLDPSVRMEPQSLAAALDQVDAAVLLVLSPPGDPVVGVQSPDPGVRIGGGAIKNLYQWVLGREGRSRRLVIDLLLERAQTNRLVREDVLEGDHVEDAAKWLESIRVPRGTTWNRSVIRRVLRDGIAPQLPSVAAVVVELRQKVRRRLSGLLSFACLVGIPRADFIPVLRCLRGGRRELHDAIRQLDAVSVRCWEKVEGNSGPLVAYSGGGLP